MEITIIETSAYLELKRQLSMLSVQLGDPEESVSGITGEVVGRPGSLHGTWHIQKMPAEPPGQGADPLFEHRREMLLQGSGYPANTGRRSH